MKDPQKLAEAFFSEMTEEQLTANQEKWLGETLQEIMEME
ncbi:exonuclease SbcCD subunit D, partial [Lacticaseibacillus rhamnosus]